MKTYNLKYLKPVETDELDDIQGRRLFGEDYNLELLYDNIKTSGEQNSLESYPIYIGDLEKIIEYHKKEGANYIAIDYHVDHNTYITQGVKILEDDKT